MSIFIGLTRRRQPFLPLPENADDLGYHRRLCRQRGLVMSNMQRAVEQGHLAGLPRGLASNAGKS